jgi:hypothetical protein
MDTLVVVDASNKHTVLSLESLCGLLQNEGFAAVYNVKQRAVVVSCPYDLNVLLQEASGLPLLCPGSDSVHDKWAREAYERGQREVRVRLREWRRQVHVRAQQLTAGAYASVKCKASRRGFFEEPFCKRCSKYVSCTHLHCVCYMGTQIGPSHCRNRCPATNGAQLCKPGFCNVSDAVCIKSVAHVKQKKQKKRDPSGLTARQKLVAVAELLLMDWNARGVFSVFPIDLLVFVINIAARSFGMTLKRKRKGNRAKQMDFGHGR